jgi:hypothetical protein
MASASPRRHRTRPFSPHACSPRRLTPLRRRNDEEHNMYTHPTILDLEIAVRRAEVARQAPSFAVLRLLASAPPFQRRLCPAERRPELRTAA